ncbi:hypothetical protein FRZ44_13290 [Hypericibacter terrae]|uniref:ATP-binding protein n=1 Tax=Hypericibacter terrae TaxID=2602015 RepID=A0A5J6MG27_9PROT|nr:ATP-binding protein [Hypericibacter terrae]QEX16037.1 hypothetical protein FRZ44_13290 [Hypericibacter terrae]
MRKRDYRQELWNQRHAQYVDGRRRASYKKKKSRRRAELLAQAPEASRKPVHLPGVPKQRYRVTIPLPADLSLARNYEEVMSAVNQMRESAVRRQRGYVDFRPVRSLGPGAALVLTAELDRWRRLRRLRMSPLDLDEWDINVLAQLDEMGLFEVLDSWQPKAVPRVAVGYQFIRFRAGVKVAGALAREVRLALEEVGAEIRNRAALFGGLTEAMANVLHHAYPHGEKYVATPIQNQWWMSGAYNSANAQLSVQFFDQGVGIPTTLPRKHPAERIKGVLSSLGLPDDDASRIKAAMLLGRSRTSEPHRGGGLSDIKAFVEATGKGRLRILSGRGQYIYDTQSGETLLTHREPLGGTLIEWEVATTSENPSS